MADTSPDSDSEDDDEPVDGGEDDWRKFFDEPKDAEKNGSKKDGKAGSSVRLNKLTVHQSLHSLPSHRAVFTRLWLTLLPQLRISAPEGKGKAAGEDVERKRKEEEDMVVRALSVMHRGVMPHLTRAVMCMDWVGGCVDYGASIVPFIFVSHTCDAVLNINTLVCEDEQMLMTNFSFS